MTVDSLPPIEFDLSLNDEYSIYRTRNMISLIYEQYHSILSTRIKQVETIVDQLDFFVRVCLFLDSNFAEDYLTEMMELNKQKEDFYYINIRNMFYRVFTDYYPVKEFDNFQIMLFNFENEKISSFESTLFVKYQFKTNSQLIISTQFQNGYFRAQNFLIKLRIMYLKFKNIFRKTMRVPIDLLKVSMHLV